MAFTKWTHHSKPHLVWPCPFSQDTVRSLRDENVRLAEQCTKLEAAWGSGWKNVRSPGILPRNMVIYPLVDQHSYWKWLFISIYSGITNSTWWFSIVMLVYQRVTSNFVGDFPKTLVLPSAPRFHIHLKPQCWCWRHSKAKGQTWSGSSIRLKQSWFTGRRSWRRKQQKSSSSSGSSSSWTLPGPAIALNKCSCETWWFNHDCHGWPRIFCGVSRDTTRLIVKKPPKSVLTNWLVVWNMAFMTLHILGIIIPSD